MNFYYQSLKETQISIVKKKKKKQFDCYFSMIKPNNTNFTQLQYFTHAYTIREKREVNLLTVKPETCRTQP